MTRSEHPRTVREDKPARFVIRVMSTEEACFFCSLPTKDRLARICEGSAFASTDLLFLCRECQPGTMRAIQQAARARRGEAPDADDEDQPTAHRHVARVSMMVGMGQTIEKCACGASRYVKEVPYQDSRKVWRTRYERDEWVEGERRAVPRVR